MSKTVEHNPPRQNAPASPGGVPLTVNEMRLGAREWLATLAVVSICFIAIPQIWKKIEPLRTEPNYRIPYALSNDYWLFQRRVEQDVTGDRIPLLGDSVVWGEYVRPDGTLSHFLNQRVGQPDRFVNCGVNGMFPLALEGLLDDYGKSLRNRKVIIQYNLLWMTSPKADLSEDKEEDFNHAKLVPQFTPNIPCYRADANARLSAVIDRNVGFFGWVDHLQDAYYDHRSIPQWTLAAQGDPTTYPNAWRNPLQPLRHGIPGEPRNDPLRGPLSRRHKPWNADGAEPSDFEWVGVDRSLQWAAFNRVVHVLRERGNDVLIILGPFNEHMIADDQLPVYRNMRDTIGDRLLQDGFDVIIPDVLPTDEYADASHPLTAGYAILARRLLADERFTAWLEKRAGK